MEVGSLERWTIVAGLLTGLLIMGNDSKAQDILGDDVVPVYAVEMIYAVEIIEMDQEINLPAFLEGVAEESFPLNPVAQEILEEERLAEPIDRPASLQEVYEVAEAAILPANVEKRSISKPNFQAIFAAEKQEVVSERVDHYSDYYGGCNDFIPYMLGDFLGGFFFGPPPLPNTQPRAAARAFRRFKVADNNSPFPRTRALYSYNFFKNAFNSNGDVHRNTFGGEYAFFGQRMSVEIRVPINTLADFAAAPNQTEIGDMRSTFKVLLFRTDSTAVAGGLAIGWPTGDAPGGLNQGNTYFMPYVGIARSVPGSDWYVQTFSQLDIPTENQDLVLLQNDLGVGYFLFRGDGTALSIVPTAELHLYTPIGAAGGFYDQLNYNDVLNATVGTTIIINPNATLALGLGFPITSQNDYDLEIMLHLNWIFGGIR